MQKAKRTSFASLGKENSKDEALFLRFTPSEPSHFQVLPPSKLAAGPRKPMMSPEFTKLKIIVLPSAPRTPKFQ